MYQRKFSYSSTHENLKFMLNLHSNLPKTLLNEKNIILLIIHIFIMYVKCKHAETVFVNTTILAMNVNFVKLVLFGCLIMPIFL